ncbi:MAG: family 43 glycosylhydrolase, partial [Limisphaera sp.]
MRFGNSHSTCRGARLALCGFFMGLFLCRGSAQAQEPLTGSLGAHDPSSMIRAGDRYYVFTTGRGIPIKVSTNRLHWSSAGTVFPVDRAPAWTTNAVPQFDGTFWAPDVVYVEGRYLLYYSVSSWGSQVSAIGLATSPTIEPVQGVSPWTDQGPVIQSRVGDPYNCIDPSVFRDWDGRLWLVFGSYWQGIYIVELDPQTGMRLQPSAPPVRLAWNDQIEAAHLTRRGPYYYLFVNWGTCCAGIDSTYQIRVGRALSPTGPFRDRNGVDLVQRGGEVFLESSGRFVGPGHAALFHDGSLSWVTFHYYDGLDRGIPKLGMARVEWTSDGWPVAGLDWNAFYSLETDARDHGRLYDGALHNGARLEAVPDRGQAARLNGTGEYVSLPTPLANARTVAFWARWDGGPNWQRFLDFGDGTSRYFFLTPRADNGRLRCALTTSGPAGELRLDAPMAFPTGSWAHVAVTFESRRAVLYFNGIPVAIRSNVALLPWQIQARSNYLGLSQWPDPSYRGWIDSLRVHGRALTATEVQRLAWVHPALAHWYDFAVDTRDRIGTAHPRALIGVTQSSDGLVFHGTSE